MCVERENGRNEEKRPGKCKEGGIVVEGGGGGGRERFFDVCLLAPNSIVLPVGSCTAV